MVEPKVDLLILFFLTARCVTFREQNSGDCNSLSDSGGASLLNPFRCRVAAGPPPQGGTGPARPSPARPLISAQAEKHRGAGAAASYPFPVSSPAAAGCARAWIAAPRPPRGEESGRVAGPEPRRRVGHGEPGVARPGGRVTVPSAAGAPRERRVGAAAAGLCRCRGASEAARGLCRGSPLQIRGVGDSTLARLGRNWV